ncbi:hypothetical protein ACFYNO_17145 [Kitasatospora sp. NPDC006697]|uniref:hypothetical protein n=1 Tax=Kitasatospora sp. NPDC006697 TaxID=3364020 RepID=UPI0036A6E5B1
MQQRPLVGWFTAVLALAATTAGCGGSSAPARSQSGDAVVPASLPAALSQAHADSTARHFQLLYGTGGQAANGEPALAAAASQLPQLTGIDPASAATALSVGAPPTAVGFLYGSFDTAAIGTKLTALGYHRQDLGHGEALWTIRDDHQLDAGSPLTELGIAGELNVIRLSPARLVYGGAHSDLDRALATSGPALADDRLIGGLASCLGDTARAAQIGQDPTVGAAPFGLGISQAGGEVVCLSAPSADAAQAMATAWPQRAATANSAKTDQPWSTRLADPAATVVGGPAHLVRLTARPTDSDQVLFQASMNQDLGELLGGLGTRP